MKASSLYSNNRMLKSFQVRVSPVPWVKQHVTCRWICSWVPVSKLQQDKTSALCYRLLYFRCSLPQANYGARRSPTHTNPGLQHITHKKPNITPSFTTSAFSSQLIWKNKHSSSAPRSWKHNQHQLKEQVGCFTTYQWAMCAVQRVNCAIH